MSIFHFGSFVTHCLTLQLFFLHQVVDRQLDRVGIFHSQDGSLGEMRVEISTAVLGKVIAVACMGNGDIVFSRDKHSICVYDAQGQHKTTVKDNLSKPGGLWACRDQHLLYVLDYHTKTVTR